MNKAGLALDQTEINRVIAEASKGSKFYENERKKDAELTVKIDNLLKKKDDAMRGVDISAYEPSRAYPRAFTLNVNIKSGAIEAAADRIVSG